MKTIIVTGASRGIGQAIAMRLLKDGCHVILIARDIERLNRIAEQLPNQTGVFPADLADLASYADVMDQIVSTYPDIDGIVHNAGIGVFGSIDEIPFDDWQQQINVNLNAAVLATQKILPGMKQRQSGHICFVNSVASGQIFPGGTAYGVSKAALKMFADSMREELRPYRIAVSSIYPAATGTDWWNGTNFPREEMLSPDVIADAVAKIFSTEFPAVIEDLTIRRIQGDF